MRRVVKSISVDSVRRYSELANIARGTALFKTLWLQHEYKSGNGWKYDGWSTPSVCGTDLFYIKQIDNVYLLYRVSDGVDTDRFTLNRAALKFFNIEE